MLSGPLLDDGDRPANLAQGFEITQKNDCV